MRVWNRSVSLALQLAALVMIWISALSVQAQSSYGAITGTVTDTSGAVVAGAEVTLVNLGTNEAKTAQSGTSGEYRFVNLVPSNYKVAVEAKSFKRFEVGSVAVQVDNTVRVDAQLQIGATTETVEVTTETPQLQTESGSVSSEVEGEVVQQMPLNGRNAMNLVALVPGVVPGNYTAGSASFNTGNRTQNTSWDNYQIGGGFPNQNGDFIDGASVNVLGNTIALIPTQDATQEFRVQTNAPSAEFGRFGGGAIEMATKSGSNSFHGTVYEYVRNTILNSNYFFSNNSGLPKAPFHQNQYGVAVGGPVKKDKIFFFFSWENFALRTATPLPTNVPTPAQLAGTFSDKDPVSGKARVIQDPSGRCSGITHNVAAGTYSIPTSCFDPTSLVMAKYFASPNLLGNASYNFTAAPVVGDNTTQYNARIDFNLSEKQRIFGRYSYWPVNDTGVNEFNHVNGFPTTYAATHNLTHSVVLGDTYTFSPNTIGDLRVAYTRELFTNPALSLNNVNMSQFGPAYAQLASQVSYQALPNLTFQGSDSIFNLIPISVVQFDHYDNYGLYGSLTKIIGNHSLKFGGEGVLRLHNGTGNFNDPAGLSTFSNATTGDEVASFLLGEFTTDAIQTILPTTTFNYSYAFYGTDTWKVNRSLTVNMGLRYELPGGLEEKKDRMTVLLPNTVDPATGLKGAVALVNSNLYPSRSVEPYHYMLFSPRFSFAQSLHNNSVVRGGYALLYLPPDLPGGLQATTSPINAAVTTSINGGVPTLFQQNPFPNGILKPVGRSNPNFSQKLLGQPVTGVVPENTYPYLQQWNLSMGHQWPSQFSTEIVYAGAKGTHLPMSSNVGLDQVPDSLITSGALQTMENNLLPPIGTLTTAQAQSQVSTYAQAFRPYPQFQNYSNTVDYSGGSNYNAMYVILQKRFRSGSLINFNYTWAKMIDNVGTIQDFYNKSGNRALDTNDVAHRVVINYVVNLPFGKGEPFAHFDGIGGVLVSGWTANGIATIQDGLPLAMTYNGNILTRNLGAGTLRPNYIPGCQRRTSGSSFQKFKAKNWFNAACFTYPGDFSFGNEARVDPVLRSQGLTDFDFSLAKTTPIRESVNLQFRAEAFNLFNHPYFYTPGTQMAGNNYDDINTQNNPPVPRLIQLSLRLNF